MGAGKTQLVQCVLDHLQNKDQVSSPTFTFINEYRVKDHAIFHADLYRIEGEEDLETLGLWELFLTKGKVWIFIEWPEKIEGFEKKIWPKGWDILEVRLQLTQNPSQREMLLQRVSN